MAFVRSYGLAMLLNRAWIVSGWFLLYANIRPNSYFGISLEHGQHGPFELQASLGCSVGSILVFPLISHPMAKPAIAITMTTKAITKIRNKLDGTLSPIMQVA